MITVIIPSYNHVLYLRKRIDSILQQSFSDFEIIILDDCSTDNSQEVIAEYSKSDPRIKFFFNKTNSGSTFKQWNKGFELASGEYVWIAESDDYADKDFLTKLSIILDSNPHVSIAYTDSITVDESDNQLGEIKNNANNISNSTLFDNDFIMNGYEFIKRYMISDNLIPNASAVLMRKSSIEQVGGANASMKLAGDWLYWNKLLTKGDIAYVSQPLNFFRTHSNNVRSNTKRNGVLIKEISEVMLYTKKNIFIKKYDNIIINRLIDNWRVYNRLYKINIITNLVILKNIVLISGFKILLRKLQTRFFRFF